MARTATGSPRWNPRTKIWEARVTVNGKREPVPLRDAPPCRVTPSKPPPGCKCASCCLVREAAQIVSDRYRREGRVPDHVGEVASEWFARYIKRHAELGNGTAQHMGDWRTYVEPTIGTRTMAAITVADIKAIRDNLTALRLEGKISGKRGMNIWSTVVKAPLSRAFTDDDPKYTSVRVGPFASNPASGIKPPASRADCADDERERQALDPSEAVVLLSCEEIPIDTRRRYAWAMFTGLRPAELYGLTWADVRERVIKVQRGRDMKTGVDGRTKTKASVRDVPIHPHLAPLIDAMRGTGRVFPIDRVREVEHHARELRAHLLTAGIDRPELHDGTSTLRPFDVRSFRTCFATWCARSGFDSAWIDAWLGHAPKTTAGAHYVKDTGAMTSGVFPSLPGDLLPAGPIVANWTGNTPKTPSKQCEGRDLNTDSTRREPSPYVAPSPAKTGSVAIGDVASETTPQADSRRSESVSGQPTTDPDEALRVAIKAALDAGDLARASALLEVLKASPKPATVVQLAPRKPR